MPEELHIAGLVVLSTPRRVRRVSEVIAAIPGATVHGASAAGKLVVTLEAATADEMTSTVTRIQRTAGVLSAALVSQYADTLEAMNETLS